MLDLTALIAAADPMLAGWRVLPPEPPLEPLWRTLVQLRGGAGAGDRTALTPSIVGAYGHSRRDSVVRGFGEAIERAALLPGGAAGLLPEPGADARLLDAAHHGLMRPEDGPPRDTGPRLLARSLVDGQCWAVPAALVDHPAGSDGAEFDPGPSGAASGLGADQAVRSALLEILERDAIVVAWDVGLALPRIEPASLSAPASTRSRAANAALTRLLGLVGRLGAEIVLAEIPTVVAGVHCVCAVLIDRDDRGEMRAAVGSNADDDPWVALLGAAQESLQIRSLLHAVSASRRPVAADEVVDEQSRLDRLSSRAGTADVLSWVGGFSAPRVPPLSGASTESILRDVAADGGDPLLVDLGDRLPSAVRELGWTAVKIVPVGLQPLRLDERHAWSWNTARRVRLVERWQAEGLAVARPGGGGPPHPLP